MSDLFNKIIVLSLLHAGCDPFGPIDPSECTVNTKAFITNTNQLDFDLDMSEDDGTLQSFTLRNDACRHVRFNYMNVKGEDADAYIVLASEDGTEPWINSGDSIEVVVEFSPEEPGHYTDAYVEIKYSYPETGVLNDVGVIDRIYLRGTAIRVEDSAD